MTNEFWAWATVVVWTVALVVVIGIAIASWRVRREIEEMLRRQ